MNPGDENSDLPEALRKELGQLFAPGEILRDVGRDAAILAAARRAGEGMPSGRWRWAVGAGLAAAVALAATLWWVETGDLSKAKAAARNRVVLSYQRTGDIRDAYYVARQVKSGQALEASWDANHDGRVDDADAVSLAMAAVRVEKDKGGTQ